MAATEKPLKKQLENHWQGLPAVEKRLESKGKTATATKKTVPNNVLLNPLESQGKTMITIDRA